MKIKTPDFIPPDKNEIDMRIDEMKTKRTLEKIKEIKDSLWEMQTSKLISNEERSIIVRKFNAIEDRLNDVNDSGGEQE